MPQDKESCSRSVAATTSGTRGASGFQIFTSGYHEAEVLAKVMFAMSKNDPALRVMKAVAG
jgi:hypothetical protein